MNDYTAHDERKSLEEKLILGRPAVWYRKVEGSAILYFQTKGMHERNSKIKAMTSFTPCPKLLEWVK